MSDDACLSVLNRNRQSDVSVVCPVLVADAFGLSSA